MTPELPRTAEYGQVERNGWPTAERTVVAKTWSARFRAEVELAQVSAGYACAGSAMRLDAACWSVRWMQQGAFQGRRFTPEDEADARAFFARVTGPLDATS